MRKIFISLAVFFVTLPLWAQTENVPPPKSFKLCAACHVTAHEDMYRTAPPLDGVVGRNIASVPNFEYSDRLLKEPGVWTEEKLDAFLERPNHAQPGTGMYFRGLRNAKGRKILIDWLAGNAVPEVVTPSELHPPAEAMNPDERAAQLFRTCAACHSFGEGEPAKIGPNLWDVVGRPVASYPGFNYSERLARRGGVWDEANLMAFFSEQKFLEQGTHMAFRNMVSVRDKELIIGMLKTLSTDKTAD